MSDTWKSIKIREFEHVLAAPSVALLRVSGKPRRRHIGAGPRPVLLADDGQTVWRFAAIPSPPDNRGLLRAAFSVSSDLVAPNTVFSLEAADGSIIALPTPSAGANRLAPELPAESAGPTDGPPSSDERRWALVTKLTELSSRLAESEQTRSSLEVAASEARVEAGEARVEADQARIEADEARVEADQARVEADQARVEADQARVEADQARVEAGEARVEADQANEQLASLRGHITDLEQRLTEADQRAVGATLERAAAQERADELQHVCQQLEQSNEEQREHLRRLEHDVAEAVAARDELEHSVAPLRAAREHAEHELLEAHDAVRTMTIENTELSRQASAFDAVAVKARERASQAEAEAEKALTSVKELETWNGELERRLTDTTDELTAAKIARTQDHAELRRLGGEFAEADAKVELLQAQVKILNDQLTEAGNGRPARDAPVGDDQGRAASDDDALTSAREEIVQLQAQLAQARDSEADLRIDAIRHAAEAEAREVAERELTKATTVIR